MFPKLLAGSVVALSIGQTYAAGYAWSGVNMGGFDFGCTTDGACNIDNIVPPLQQYKGQDGAGQMKHFVDDAGLNAFRLPVAWQFLVNNKVGGTIDATAMTQYDALVQACLDTGAYCIIDIHNYARWNGDIIGQGGPKDADFASLWSQLATKYAKDANVVMGIVNEPHDIPDLTIWTTTVQSAVTAIRRAGATNHTILLPGTGYTSAESFVSSGSGAALAKVTNPDGSTSGLVFDVHKYLDSDNSGTHTACVGNDISAAFAPLATWLRQQKRQALLSEIGGGSAATSCMTDVCQVADYLNANSDVYLGMLGWAAGSFDESYILTLTPTQEGGTWKDQPLLTKCFAEKFQGGAGVAPSNTTSGSDTETGTDTSAPTASQTLILGGTLPTFASSSSLSSSTEPPTPYPLQNSSSTTTTIPSTTAPLNPPIPTTTPTTTTLQTIYTTSASAIPSPAIGTEPGNAGGGATMWGSKGKKPVAGQEAGLAAGLNGLGNTTTEPEQGAWDQGQGSEEGEEEECEWVEDDEE